MQSMIMGDGHVWIFSATLTSSVVISSNFGWIALYNRI